MHNSCVFLFFVQKSFLTKSCLLIAVINLTTWGPLYTCPVYFFLESIQALDIIYAIDASSTVSQQTFNQMKNFVLKDIKTKPISSHTRVGIVQYGSRGDLVVAPVDGTNLMSIEATLNNMKQIGGQRNVRVAVEFLNNVISNPSRTRPDSKKIVVFMINGPSLHLNRPWNANDIQYTRRLLQSSADEVVIVAMNNNVRETDFSSLATIGGGYFVFNPYDISSISITLANIIAHLSGMEITIAVYD